MPKKKPPGTLWSEITHPSRSRGHRLIDQPPAKPGDRLVDKPAFWLGLALIAPEVAPELGVAGLGLRLFARLELLQMVALEYAAQQIRQDLPKAFTRPGATAHTPPNPRSRRHAQDWAPLVSPTAHELHQRLTEYAAEGAMRGFSHGGARPQRAGSNRIKVELL